MSRRRERPRPRPGRRAGAALALVIRAATWAGARVPAWVAHGLARVGGNLEWAVRPTKRQQLAVNLGHALGADPRSRVVRRAVRREIVNEARRSADLLWALGRPGEFLATTTVTGMAPVQALLADGSGAVLVGTHLGGWEVATSVPAAHLSQPTHVIVADDWLAWGIEHARVAAGLHILPAAGAALESVRILRRGECVLMLGDDGSFSDRTYRVRLFDTDAELPAGPVTLARLGCAPIVGFTVLPLGPRRWHLHVEAPIAPPATRADEADVLQQLADRWSATISAAPDHWAASFPIRWIPPTDASGSR